MTSRRDFMASSALTGIGLVAGSSPGQSRAAQDPPPLARPTGSSATVARDEAYWSRVSAYYRVSDRFTNLEAGFFGMMASPVLADYHRHIDRVNRESSHYARRGYETDLQAARMRVARFFGVKETEIAFSRGATEALQCLIGGYRRLQPGDAVLYADLDYNAMQFAMNWLAERRGVTVAKLVIPEPASRDNVLAAYAEALDANPRVRLLLLTHLNNKTGSIIPVREIAVMARARGVDVIVDAAHSFGQTELRLGDLGVDFLGLNLHKWLGAPVGVGVMYIRDGRLGDIDRMMADESQPADRIGSRIHSGTSNFAAFLTVPAALDFHDAVGPGSKAARVRYLRDRWVGQVRKVPGVSVLASDGPDEVGAITSFRIHGRTSKEANQRIVDELLESYGLFTVWRTGISAGDCVRATPALYNTPAHADRLAAAISAIAGRG